MSPNELLTSDPEYLEWLNSLNNRERPACWQIPEYGAHPTIPAAANRCSETALTYLVLVTTALPDWTAADYADFAAARAGL